MLSYEYEKRKVYVEARSETNICCCLAVFTFLPEALVELSTMLTCLIPGCFIDCCQEAVDNSTSLNMIMIENKLLHVNDEIILSKDFNADELFDMQYKRGSWWQFFTDRRHYVHQASQNLIDFKVRKSNEKLHMFHMTSVKGKIVNITLSGNLHVEFDHSNEVKSSGDSKEFHVISPLVVERTTLSADEIAIYEDNKKYIRKGEWYKLINIHTDNTNTNTIRIKDFKIIDETAKISFENPKHHNYQTPPDALIPCFSCAGFILSIFCALPSWYINTNTNTTMLTLIKSWFEYFW